MSPVNNAELPDALDHVLTALKGECNVYWYNELDRPWGLTLDPSEFAYFHVLERGDGIIRLKGQPAALPVTGGDLVILPHGGGHVIADGPMTPPLTLGEFVRLAARGSLDDTG